MPPTWSASATVVGLLPGTGVAVAQQVPMSALRVT
jgi:hypothetical protein